jgi:hypothetical protein
VLSSSYENKLQAIQQDAMTKSGALCLATTHARSHGAPIRTGSKFEFFKKTSPAPGSINDEFG